MNGEEDVTVTTETFMLSQQLYESGRLYDMTLADLQQDPNQPRKYLDPVGWPSTITDPDVMGEKDDSPETTPKKILS